MKRFLIHYHAPVEAMAQMAKSTPEQQEAGMKLWMNWKAKVGDGVVDFGAPTRAVARVNGDGSQGDANSEVTGYSILQANDIEEVRGMLQSHPHLNWMDKVAIEIYECIEM